MLLRHGLTRFLFIAAYCSISDARAATYLVRPDGSGDFPDISGAVAVAQNGDEIILGDGVFTGQANQNILIFRKTLTIRSESRDPSRCMIDCEQHPRASRGERHNVFFIRGTGNTVLEGITFTRGLSDIGGAISIWHSSPRVRNCVFINNTAQQAGAIMCAGDPIDTQGTRPILENCVIANNVSMHGAGGGIFCGQYSHMTIIGCTIANNAVFSNREGGGIAVSNGSSITVRNSIISGQLYGEAVHCDDRSSATLSCTNVFGNAGGDWTGSIADQATVNGNFSLDPLFCAPENRVFTLGEDSPCAPPGFAECGLVGALPVACERPTFIESSWGRIKGVYR